MAEEKKVATVTPVPDNPAGANLPYRGVVDHGVPYPEVEPTDEAHYHSGRPVEFDTEEVKEPEPIPVKVVHTGQREIRGWRTMRVRLTEGIDTSIVGRDEKRTKISIRNPSANDIYVSDQPGAGVAGYQIPQGAELTLTTTESVFGYVPTGTADKDISVAIEFVQPVR